MEDKSKQAVAVYDKVSQQYFKEFDEPSFQIDRFVELLPPKAKVLDVGCGIGSDIKYLTSKNFQVEGIDLSKNMLEIARKQNPNAILKNSDMRYLNYPENSFNGILSSFSLIHIPKNDVANTIQYYYNFLKPKGIVFIAIQEGKSEEIYITEPLKPTEKIFLNYMLSTHP